jgi:hypothetical protein
MWGQVQRALSLSPSLHTAESKFGSDIVPPPHSRLAIIAMRQPTDKSSSAMMKGQGNLQFVKGGEKETLILSSQLVLCSKSLQ